MECVTDQLVNTAGAFEQYPELQCLRKLLDTDREEGAKQAKLSFPPAEKTAFRAKLQQERRVKLLEKSRRQSSKRPQTQNDQAPRSQAALDKKRASRSCQTNLESIFPDVRRQVTRATRPNEGHKRSPAALPGFPNPACTSHILCSWLTRPWECKRNHDQLGPKADSDVVSESRLEFARKQAFENFISIDGEAKVLDTTSSREERQRRRKRYHASFRSVGDCLELMPTRNDYCFLQRHQKSSWISGNPGVIQNVCQWVLGIR